MKVLAPKLILVALLLGLVYADRSLDEQRVAEREGDVRVGRFVPQEEADELLVAAVSLRSGDGREFTYGRLSGVWRCLELFRAPVPEADISALLEAVRDAEGYVQSRDPARAADYGLGTADSWTIGFHGPALFSAEDRDLRLSVEVGSRVPGLDGCFLRRSGRDAVWAVDRDARAVLDGGPPEIGAPADPGAPLLDPHLKPSGWPAPGARMTGIQVLRDNGVRYDLAVRAVELPPEDVARGQSNLRWVLLADDGSERPLHPLLVVSYLNYLKRAVWQEVLDPARLDALGMREARARLRLEADDGSALTYAFGPPDDEGLRPVVNGTLDCAYLIDVQTFSLLLPDVEQLAVALDNPWELWLDK